MPKPFDATLKDLLERSPEDWPVLAGLPPAPVTVIDADISTVSGASDKVLRVQGSPDWLLDVNFQSGPDASVPRRAHLYNVLLEDRHSLMVRSLVVLLVPRANLSNLTGTYERRFPGQEPHLRFTYQVLRVWQLPPEPLLNGGLGILPLAPISSVTEAELPDVVARVQQRLATVSEPSLVRDLWTATFVLMGLRYEEAVIDRVLQGVIAMEESVTYQAIIRKGVAQGARENAREILFLLGEKQFGPPNPAVVEAINSITDLQRLRQLSLRVLEAKSWQELLA